MSKILLHLTCLIYNLRNQMDFLMKMTDNLTKLVAYLTKKITHLI